MTRPTIDEKWLQSLRPVPGLSSRDYEYSGDRTTLSALKSIPGASWIFKKWLDFWLEFERSRYLGSAVKVTEKQFPQVHKLVTRAAEVLSMSAPPVFIVEAPYLNAFTMGTDDGQSIVLVTRALLEVTTEKELMFIVGHELGHVKSQHVLYATMAIYLANVGLFAGARFPGFQLLVLPIRVALNAWFRRSEISCDRAGLIACQDVEAAQKALMVTGCGSRSFADNIDLDEFLKQSHEAAGSYGKWGELFATHPYLTKRLRCAKLFSESQLYIRKVLGDPKSRFVDPDDLDEAVGEVLGDEPEPTVERSNEHADGGRYQLAMALAGAWSDGRVTDGERRGLEALVAKAGGEGAALAPYLEKRYARPRAFREIRHYTGDRLRGLPYAFSFVLMDAQGVSVLQARLLYDLAVACGLPESGAETLVYDVKGRKAFFREQCGTDICARCARLFPPKDSACPFCGEPATSTEPPDERRIKTMAEKLSDFGRSAQASAAKAGSALMGLASPAEDAPEPKASKAPPAKTPGRKHKKKEG